MVGGGQRPARPAHRIFDAYVPRGVLHHLAAEPFRPVRTVDGTMLFADLAGFTRLSERLARRGPEGAELLVDTINACFTPLLTVAYDNGGSLLKFGGDALLLFFDGASHSARACRAAFRMRERLREVGRVEVAGVRGTLRMTVGLHSDAFHFALVGESHLEHLVFGAGATGVLGAEVAAGNGEIVLTPSTAALLPPECVGASRAGGFLLRRSPLAEDRAPVEDLPTPPTELVARTLSTAVRAHVLDGRPQPEHRRASVAFLQFGGVDALIEWEGPEAAAAAAHELVVDVQRAADDWEICFLDSDIAPDGGKLLLTAGAPRVVGDDEERMLLTLRQILDGDRLLPVRAGVNRGPTFTGEIGPSYRRAYIVMGDTTNVAARVAAQAPPGALYATAGVLERSTTRFATTAVAPFAAKGKARPVLAWAVGAARRAAAAPAGGQRRLPVMGRVAELDALAGAVSEVAAGRGVLVELTGDGGIGKTRLIEVVRDLVPGEPIPVRAACAAHTTSIPLSLWHSMLRQILGIGWDESPAGVRGLLGERCRALDPDLLPWVPLLADALGVEGPSTPEVAALLPEFQRPRLHEVVLRLLAPSLRRPTVVEIDHAHLMDEASAALLSALVPNLREHPWLVLVTGRASGASGGFTAASGAGTVSLALGPLAEEAALRLAEAATDDRPLPPHVLAQTVARAGGNPQFLLDLLDAARASVDELPDSAQAAATAVIDALAPGDRVLVRRAAVLGTTFRPEHLATLLGRAIPASAWARLDAVFDTTAGEEVRFRRALVREAAYAGLPFRERRDLHAAAAEEFEAEPKAAGPRAGVPPDPAVLSLHFAAAGRHDRAFPLAMRAGDRAMRHGAPADAARLYRSALESGRALGLTPRQLAEEWEALGGALRMAGETAAADRAFREARRAVVGDPLREAALLYRQARLAHRAGRTTAGVRWARQGLRVLADGEGPQVRAQRAALLVAEGADRLRQGRQPAAIALFRRAMAEAEGLTGPVAERAMAHACYLLDWALRDTGRAKEAVHCGRALEIYDRLGDLENKGKVLNNLGMFAYWDGRWDDAVRLYREGAALAERVGDVMGGAYGDCNVGEVLSDQGHWVEAEQLLTRVLRLWRATGDDGGCAFARMLLGRLAARTGDFAEADRLLRSAAADFARLGLDDAPLAEAYAAEAAAYAGRPDEALAAVVRLEPVAPPRLAPLLARVRALCAASPAARVTGLETALAVAHGRGSDYEAAVALDALCLLGVDDPQRAAERVELFRRLGIRRLPPPPLPRARA